MMLMRALIAVMSIASCSLSLARDVVADSEFMFNIPPDAEVFAADTRTVANYVLPLGKYKKRNNRWLLEESSRHGGTLVRYTFEFPRYGEQQDATDFFKQQLPENSTVLYECVGRSCGESNTWANNHFGVKQLYGTNASQLLSVYQLSPKKYLSLYSVRRGNRRIYVHVEVLTES